MGRFGWKLYERRCVVSRGSKGDFGVKFGESIDLGRVIKIDTPVQHD